jgi:ABC-type polysaccharide/polyol phosphate transport system ATPase subunit
VPVSGSLSHCQGPVVFYCARSEMCYHESRGATCGSAFFAFGCAGDDRLTTAIRFTHVSKRFTLHHQRPRSFQDLAIQFLRRSGETHGQQPEAALGVDGLGNEEFWALRDVTFAVEQGDTIGIIGPNGAGKSTALKLISRIIEPTSGQIEVSGRVGALLELGAGFHPDLSGRENIYLNGSILGLGRAEIDRKLDEIIAFAELQRFIDMPVKHYSSGMRLRLGFSIAAHIDPEILLVDEGLAVGDEAFQYKCIAKIAEFQRSGCTVLLVSHSLSLVEGLCTRAIWLQEGKIQQQGRTVQVVTAYRGGVDEQLKADSTSLEGDGETFHHGTDFRICAVQMIDASGKPRWTYHSGEEVRVRIAYESDRRLERPVFSILIHRSDGVYVSSTNTYNIDPKDLGPIEGRGEVVVTIDHLDLHRGNYFLSVGAYYEPDPPYWSTEADLLDRAFQFNVLSCGRHGVVALPASWEHGDSSRG